MSQPSWITRRTSALSVTDVPSSEERLTVPRRSQPGRRMSVAGVLTTQDSVKVAVRVRPFNDRERAEAQAPVVAMEPHRGVTELRGAQGVLPFQFDSVFWSMDAPDADGGAPATQAEVYDEIGAPLVLHAFSGFNSCLFAYGQTGSGKTHTMMGGDGCEDLSAPDRGVIPRLCDELLRRKAEVEQEGRCTWTVEVGFVEVYNEKVSDLLAPRGRQQEDMFVDVRENPKTGVFIEGQTLKAVKSCDEILALIAAGNDQRHVAATKMNHRSSRSHAIFQLILREERSLQLVSGQTMRAAGMTSRMNLVDLAGSERVSASGVEGKQFEQAKFINLSLTTLGRVIDILASMTKNPQTALVTPPYRESKLTFLLKDSLGGNSKTFMVAAVSPSALNYDETLSTLRYASRARDIVNTAKVNEDPQARRIRELEEEMARMRLTPAPPGRRGTVVGLEEKLALMQAESERRAADLHTLQLERSKFEMNQRLLSATEEEKAALRTERDRLAAEMQAAAREAGDRQAELERLRREQEAREQHLHAAHAAATAHQLRSLCGAEERAGGLLLVTEEQGETIGRGHVELAEARAWGDLVLACGDRLLSLQHAAHVVDANALGAAVDHLQAQVQQVDALRAEAVAAAGRAAVAERKTVRLQASEAALRQEHQAAEAALAARRVDHGAAVADLEARLAVVLLERDAAEADRRVMAAAVENARDAAEERVEYAEAAAAVAEGRVADATARAADCAARSEAALREAKAALTVAVARSDTLGAERDSARRELRQLEADRDAEATRAAAAEAGRARLEGDLAMAQEAHAAAEGRALKMEERLAALAECGAGDIDAILAEAAAARKAASSARRHQKQAVATAMVAAGDVSELRARVDLLMTDLAEARRGATDAVAAERRMRVACYLAHVRAAGSDVAAAVAQGDTADVALRRCGTGVLAPGLPRALRRGGALLAGDDGDAPKVDVAALSRNLGVPAAVGIEAPATVCILNRMALCGLKP